MSPRCGTCAQPLQHLQSTQVGDFTTEFFLRRNLFFPVAVGSRVCWLKFLQFSFLFVSFATLPGQLKNRRACCWLHSAIFEFKILTLLPVKKSRNGNLCYFSLCNFRIGRAIEGRRTLAIVSQSAKDTRKWLCTWGFSSQIHHAMVDHSSYLGLLQRCLPARQPHSRFRVPILSHANVFLRSQLGSRSKSPSDTLSRAPTSGLPGARWPLPPSRYDTPSRRVRRPLLRTARLG